MKPTDSTPKLPTSSSVVGLMTKPASRCDQGSRSHKVSHTTLVRLRDGGSGPVVERIAPQQSSMYENQRTSDTVSVKCPRRYFNAFALAIIIVIACLGVLYEHA